MAKGKKNDKSNGKSPAKVPNARSTQFGQPGANPTGNEQGIASNDGIRKQIQRIARLSGKPEDLILENFQKKFNDGGDLSFSQLAALRLWQRAASGDLRALDRVMDTVDGKLEPERKGEMTLEMILIETHKNVQNRRQKVIEADYEENDE